MSVKFRNEVGLNALVIWPKKKFVLKKIGVILKLVINLNVRNFFPIGN